MSAKPRTAGGARTLPGHYYTDDAVFAREQEQIFARHWLCAGRQDRLDGDRPGRFFLHQVGAESVILTRDHSGAVRGFYNVCRHRGARLCSADGDAPGGFRCVYHGWTYGHDGRLAGAPNMAEVAGFDRADYPLVEVPTATWGGYVFVHLTSDPTSFATVFAPILDKFADWQLDRLVVRERVVYDVAANWKLIFENYAECYHCPTLHPALNRLTPYRDSDNDLEQGLILGGPMTLAAEDGSMTETGRRCAPVLGTVSGPDRRRIYYYTVFPTLFLSLHPDYVLTYRVQPVASDHTRVICEWLFDPAAEDAPDFAPEQAVRMWDRVNREDWHACELSQLGVSSRGYRPGPYAELESQSTAFDRCYLDAMKG
ncbi:aromatic ring-hydroxylating oxygenase subunit alpha [Haliangium sp.]|uniref:aromatic ring-hydroxylating oxygenase subunit alpha n=1 Tax=Haliangium sp. TaxID=2663208 RepID=UPI003D11723A